MSIKTGSGTIYCFRLLITLFFFFFFLWAILPWKQQTSELKGFYFADAKLSKLRKVKGLSDKPKSKF